MATNPFGFTTWGADLVRIAEPISASTPNTHAPRARMLARNGGVTLQFDGGRVTALVHSGASAAVAHLEFAPMAPAVASALREELGSRTEPDDAVHAALIARGLRPAPVLDDMHEHRLAVLWPDVYPRLLRVMTADPIFQDRIVQGVSASLVHLATTQAQALDDGIHDAIRRVWMDRGADREPTVQQWAEYDAEAKSFKEAALRLHVVDARGEIARGVGDQSARVDDPLRRIGDAGERAAARLERLRILAARHREGDVALRRHRAIVAAVAGKGEG